GVAISVALLPLLSLQLSAKDMTGASESLNRALEIGLLFTLPATAALIAMPMPVVDILFQRGAFSPEDAQITAAITAAMAIGLPSVVLAKILSPAFFARGDTRTPLILAAISMAANVLLAVLLMQAMGSVGIALAASLAAWINAGMMAAILSQRGHLPLDARFRRRLPRLLLAAITMGLALYAGVQFIPQLVEGTLVLRIAALAGLVLIGAILYFTLAQVLGGTDLR
ncbi:MAG TPA: lipid II flippase MurJ, partial [Rhodospirillaceae bacterium]|nr:lipid II flippase MurJ [Rhodospirillaceae bacterium]